MIKVKNFLRPFWLVMQGLQSILIKLAYQIYQSKQRKPIWLHSDRIDTGGDNGEVFFEYCAKNYKDATHIFLINSKSQHASRIRKFGKVINIKSFRHKLYFLLADKYFLSHPEIYFVNPFGSAKIFYKKYTTPKLVFLQHGITQGDLSSWLGKSEMGFWKIVTASKKEFNSFLHFPYDYTEENLMKCGFPRFDKLKNNPKNKIVIMPSWRKNLVGSFDRRSGKYSYNPKFTQSEYFKLYNQLINDPDLLLAMEKNNLVGEFFLHPSLEEQKDFKSNDIFKVIMPPYNYQKVFMEGNLLITDYSSVAFDFAYLNKPVIYCQFDDIKNGDHIYKETFITAEKDGFGPVVKNQKETVKEIVKSIDQEFKLSLKYQKRLDSFYFYRDNKNCERLLRSILE